MNALGEIIGEICKAALPIREEYFLGDPDSAVAVCTLSSIDLLRRLGDPEIHGISIVGRLLSENRGIDSMLDRLYSNRRITTMIVCGRDVRGHRAGHSLLRLHRYGTDRKNRIINSISPDPCLAASRSRIAHFRDHVTLVDMIGEISPDRILRRIKSL